MNPVIIGDCTLYHGDCLEILPTLGKVDAVVTDPPYGVGFKYSQHEDGNEGYEEWCGLWFDECLKISSTILMSCGQPNVQMWARIRPFDWQIAWLKPAAMGRSTVGFCNWEPMLLWGSGTGKSVDVFTAPIIPDDELDGHPCPKPTQWGIESVKRVADIGDLVCDPFLGSGTTGVACVRTGRKFIGIEIDENYFNIACRRIREAYEQTALFDGPVKDSREAVLFP